MGTVEDLHGHPAGSLTVTLGVIAHDAKKDELCLFARAHRRLIEGLCLVAPEDTARTLEEIGVDVASLARDTHGGDLQLAAAVVEGRIDAVIFLHDPLAALAGEPEIVTMLKACDIEKVPMATNLASAEIIMHHLANLRRNADRIIEEPDPGPPTARVLQLPRNPESHRRGWLKP